MQGFPKGRNVFPTSILGSYTYVMAIYHCHFSYLSRRGLGSVCSHTAYITASRILDERTGQLWDYTAKGREVLATFTLAPEGSPDWVYDPQTLCNRIEKHVDQRADTRFRGHK